MRNSKSGKYASPKYSPAVPNCVKPLRFEPLELCLSEKQTPQLLFLLEVVRTKESV